MISTPVLTLTILLESYSGTSTYAHFYGLKFLENKTVGNYKIVFQPYPTAPLAGDNSTQLNFSILDKYDQNINGMFASLIIKDKEIKNVLATFPYKFYAFSDMTIPYEFKKPGEYTVSLEAKINGDPEYSEKPLIVDFNLPVKTITNIVPYDQLLLFYVIPGLAAMVSIVLYLRRKRAL